MCVECSRVPYCGLCFLWCIHIIDGGGVFIIYCVWGVLCFCGAIHVMVAAACYRVLCFYVFHICEGGGACGDNICVHGGACAPLIYDYYNVLYGAILRFCGQNRYFKSI